MENSLPCISIIVSVIGGCCIIIGHLLIGSFNTYLKNKDIKYLLYSKKLELYAELIDAYYTVVKTPSEKIKYVALQKKVELIANNEIISISQRFYNSKQKDNIKIIDMLISAMREDLEKTNKKF